ncbi:hypothetical protein [Companilactobacillus keshanensis]|uniref:Integral membrane protein n=1 Tax=Companilactobacillus keshanensis TaxID=2486003 RepID=A0ABW4BSS8_9LACO|nr:hypothetical protein [Companilactobacillus keshanensis]
MEDYFKWILGVLITFTVVPYLTARIVSWIGHVAKKALVNNLGNNSQLVIGGLGVVIHELGHAIFAFIFGHKVTKVQLLNVHYQNSGALGSVQHSWNESNIYQRLGNFFIGLAPYYTCSIALYLLQRFLLKAQFNFSSIGTETTLDATNLIESVLNNLKTAFANGTWSMIILYLILTIMIASTGYDLSDADFSTVHKGIIPWLIVQFVVGNIFIIVGKIDLLNSYLLYFTSFSILFMVHAIISMILAIIVIKILGIFEIF